MLIKSKKTGVESIISISEYQKMKEMGIHSNFIIIDNTEHSEPIDSSPKIIEFLKKNPAEVVVVEEKSKRKKSK